MRTLGAHIAPYRPPSPAGRLDAGKQGGAPMSMEMRIAVILGIMIVLVLLILWGLFGPRRPSDESGHHVDLAEETRKRDAERRRRQAEGGDDDGDDD